MRIMRRMGLVGPMRQMSPTSHRPPLIGLNVLVAFCAFCAILSLTACRTSREATLGHSARRDTAYVARWRTDTLRTADTLRLVVRERADTVYVSRERISWRERTALRRDTLWRERRDTVVRRERVEVERPRRMRDWAVPMAAGAAAGFSAAALLLRRRASGS